MKGNRKNAGQSTLSKYGKEFYVRIGRMGGQACVKKHGLEHFRMMGQLGGQKTMETYGPEHYSEIGGMPRIKKEHIDAGSN
jgi:general stress protein YciG